MGLVRNTLVQSSLTLGSRILGFVRDILIAAKVGAGPVGDAFVTALMFPNLFRRIFAEGAFAQAFIPAYARTLEAEGPEAAADVAQVLLQSHPVSGGAHGTPRPRRRPRQHAHSVNQEGTILRHHHVQYGPRKHTGKH